MKKIYLSGITNPMSDNEMRNTRGGANKPAPPPLTIGEEACAGLPPDSPCSISEGTNGQVYKSLCWFDDVEQKMHCGKY